MKPELSLEVLPSVRHAYRQFLNTEDGAGAYERFKHDLYTDDDSLIQVLNNAVLQYLPVLQEDVVRVCDVGGGSGRRVQSILKFLHQKFGLRFMLDFVEQSSFMMRMFDPKGVSSFCGTERFEMLFEDANLAGGYDLVLLIHSIFAFESDAAVAKVLSLTKPGGTIIAVSNEPNSFLAGLKKTLDAGYGDSRFEVSDLLETLEARGVAVRTIPFETRWALPKDELKRHTKTLLDWLSLGKLTEIGRDVEEQVDKYIRDNSLDLGQRVLFAEKEMIVVATV